jgi:hypothetical protein
MPKFKVGDLVTVKGWEGRVFTITEITPPRFVKWYADQPGWNLPLMYKLDNGISVEEKNLKISTAFAAAAGGRRKTGKHKHRGRKTRRARK